MIPLRVGDFGTLLKLPIQEGGVAVDLSTAVVKVVILKAPSGVVQINSAVFFTDGVDGVLAYQLAAGDLYEAGTWTVQAYAELAGGGWHSTTRNFSVAANLDD